MVNVAGGIGRSSFCPIFQLSVVKYHSAGSSQNKISYSEKNQLAVDRKDQTNISQLGLTNVSLDNPFYNHSCVATYS